MNSIQRALAYSLVGVTVSGIGCRNAEVDKKAPASNLAVVSEERPKIELPKVEPLKPLVIKTSPVMFKVEDGLIKLGILKEDQIKRALEESGVKKEHIDIFTANIKEKFAYYQDLITTGKTQLQKLEYIEDLDLSKVELNVVSGDEFDLGMGFPGEVDSRPTSDLQIDVDSLLLTDKGVYFKFTEGNSEEIKEGLIKPMFGRPIIIYTGDKEVIVIDPTKGIIIEKPEENKPQEGDKVAGVYNSTLARVLFS